MTRVLLFAVSVLVLIVAALDEPPLPPHPWIVVTATGEF